jgi:hypothetical protein
MGGGLSRQQRSLFYSSSHALIQVFILKRENRMPVSYGLGRK